ncbi:MAG: OmpA family protein, partial [Pseudomonadota bacterium]
NTPSLARPEPTEPTEPTATSDTNDGVPAPATSTQVASAGDDEILRIIFDGIDAGVGPQGDALITGLSQRLTRDESLRLQIRAYAGGTPEAATQARRLSLDRALAVRSLLIDRGVRGTRIDIRALGDSAGDGPPDRVDIIVQ